MQFPTSYGQMHSVGFGLVMGSERTDKSSVRSRFGFGSVRLEFCRGSVEFDSIETVVRVRFGSV